MKVLLGRKVGSSDCCQRQTRRGPRQRPCSLGWPGQGCCHPLPAATPHRGGLSPPPCGHGLSLPRNALKIPRGRGERPRLQMLGNNVVVRKDDARLSSARSSLPPWDPVRLPVPCRGAMPRAGGGGASRLLRDTRAGELPWLTYTLFILTLISRAFVILKKKLALHHHGGGVCQPGPRPESCSPAKTLRVLHFCGSSAPEHPLPAHLCATAQRTGTARAMCRTPWA